MDQLVLAHDVGTSGTKTSIVDAAGVLRDSQSTAHTTQTPAPGRAEQDPQDWWAGCVRNTRALVERHAELPSAVAAIGVSGHMLGCLPVDADGAPLRPSMIHCDARAAAEAAHVADALGADSVYRTTGNVVDPRSPLCKMLWLKAHEPDVYRRTWRFLQSKDYVVGRMTGSFDSTDYSDASHAQWLDIRRKTYAEELLGAVGLDAAKLPALRRATDVVGALSPSAAEALGLRAGIAVVAGGGDGSCATVGAGAAAAGDTYCCLGTTAWIASVSDEAAIDDRARVFNILCLDGEHCGVFGTVQSAGRSVDWVMNLVGEGDFASFDALLAAAPPGSDRLVFLPYLEGERSPIWDADARGVFFGITPSHGSEHFVRAAVEGVCFALRAVLDVMREGRTIDALRLIGGGARSPTWQQMLADVWGADVEVCSVQAADATSLGAAVAAGVGVGMYDDLSASRRFVTVGEVRRPDAALRGIYDRQYGVYASLYPALKPAFARLADRS